jgi:hypothetical protein
MPLVAPVQQLPTLLKQVTVHLESRPKRLSRPPYLTALRLETQASFRPPTSAFLPWHPSRMLACLQRQLGK